MSDQSEKDTYHKGSPFPYPGGKGRYATNIIEQMPDHECYVEVFGGSGATLYNKPRSDCEVYNDVNDDLVQFFRVVRDCVDELAEWLEMVPYSRTLYEQWASEYYNGERPDDPVERAGRFYTLRFMQWGGVIGMKNGFKARSTFRSPAKTFNNARDRVRSIAKRFSSVIIENQDWREILDAYDGGHVFMYLDPPYLDRGRYYHAEGFDHAALANALVSVDANWMVSYDEVPGEFVAQMIGETRSGARQFYVLEMDGYHQLAQGHGSSGDEVTERLVCNFDPTSTAQFVDGSQHQSKLSEVSA
ncbi:DNA adenine methylase [Natronorubrum daqingense]|uniref:site-specific DNA-methyltransferase (adenine-specific) n=1 Tax=Natronorubrum daqingense TaxID=588898 RepID=A0A1N7G5G2_9EURY|nr:DNA adenine methylase [Natronorubrum daqingense]APX98717.1 hypothetical protein BB347_18600 [Natronorubrum daqingense]SIS07788.1 DNA adenine methylase [Natronorubrum daqingense]